MSTRKFCGMKRGQVLNVTVLSSLTWILMWCLSTAPTVCTSRSCDFTLGFFVVVVGVFSLAMCSGLCVVVPPEARGRNYFCCGCSRKEHDGLAAGCIPGMIFFVLLLFSSWTWSSSMASCMLFFCVVGCIGLGGLQNTTRSPTAAARSSDPPPEFPL